ncbi:MAG TPA: T9SS type A sorting domain-containing protein [Ferruginibacter sp.]|nr:T9SS type A sorting domain-containing protein [Ferruginibacter sp.]
MRKLFPLLVACLFLTAAQSLKAQQCPVFEPIKPTPLIQVGNTTHVKILPGYTNHYSQLDETTGELLEITCNLVGNTGETETTFELAPFPITGTFFRELTTNCNNGTEVCFIPLSVPLTDNNTANFNWSEPGSWVANEVPSFSASPAILLTKSLQLDIDLSTSGNGWLVIAGGGAGTIPVGNRFTCNSAIQVYPGGQFLNFGTLTGSGQFYGSFVNGGSMAPGNGAGQFAINGNYTSQSSASLDIEITSTSFFDVLNVDGNAFLDGTLNVALTDGFVPSLGDNYLIMQYASASGEFTSTNLPTLPPGLAWTIHYNATNVTLEITDAPVIETPTAFLVTGGGAFCNAGAGVEIGLATSEIGVDYQMELNGNDVGNTFSGTGAAISFGLITTPGIYTVYGMNTSTFSISYMLNSVTVAVIPPNQLPARPGIISGPKDVCPFIDAESVTYSIVASRYATSFQWTVPVGATIVSGQGTTSIEVSFDGNFTSGSIEVVAVNGCNNDVTSASRTLSIIRRLPSTPGAITGTRDACPLMGTGIPTTYTIRRANYASGYNWTMPDGATATHPNGFGINDTIVEVIFDNGFTSGSIKVTSNNNCAVSSERSLLITRKFPRTPGAIAGINNPCAIAGTGLSTTYSIVPVLYTSQYNWTLPAGVNLVSQNENEITVTYDAGFTTGVIKVNASNHCYSSADRILTVTKKIPATPGMITGPTNVCPFIGVRDGVVYSIPGPVIAAESYQWTVPAGATIVSGQGTTSILVEYADFNGGFISVMSASNCGNSSLRKLTLTNSGCASTFTQNTPVNNTEEARNGNSTSLFTPVLMDEAMVYPNPSRGNFNVSIKHVGQANNAAIQLLSPDGKVMLEKKLTIGKDGNLVTNINTNGFAAGVYTLRYVMDNKIKTLRVVIL